MINEYMIQNLENFELTLAQFKNKATIELPGQLEILQKSIAATNDSIEYLTNLIVEIKKLKEGVN